jgi:outer membrane protein OmpA-like peptidoglycan-associated protein
MSPYLHALALALLLQACTTTGDGATVRSQNEPRGDISLKSQSHAQRTPSAAALASTQDEFDGPQVVFTPGSAELPRSSAPILDDIAAKLKADPLVNVVLVGHTEDLGSAEFSVAVATRCTRAVSQALVKRGARPSQIRMQPRGHSKTAARQCTTAACKKQMRRVDIVMSSY